ncbi:hypothetical protein FRC03_009106 [Tulasnella sp. 419]|nr:hypothetical protein FRC03_009106 [Tulasnella sp. 419]
MFQVSLIAIWVVASYFSYVEATVDLFGQCGGIGYSGETGCTPPNICAYYSEEYSQCIPPNRTKPVITGGPVTVLPLTRSTISRTIKPSVTKSIESCSPISSGVVGFMSNALVAAESSPSLYLNKAQTNEGGAVLSSSRMSGIFEYTNETTGNFLRISCLYLTVDELFPYSYKPLVWTTEVITKYWVVGGAFPLAARARGGTLSTGTSSPYGVRASFLACGDKEVQVYLQTGRDIPPGVTCKSIALTMEVYY